MTHAHDEDELPGSGGPRHVLPRSATRPVTTRTSAAFGALDVGPPVSRLATPTPVDVPTAAPLPLPDRCPTCNARTRGQQWCTLCHTDLRPAPEPVPALVPVAQHADAARDSAAHAADPGTVSPDADAEQLELDFGTPAEPVPAAPALDEEEVERMLRRLAAADVGRVPALASKQAKVAVAIGGSVGLTALLLGGTALIGGITG